MKKILIAFLVLTMQVAVAELSYDSRTGKYYSKNAPRNINQIEYNELAVVFFKRINKIQNIVPGAEIAGAFGMLRMVGTPTALHLIKDLKAWFEAINNDMKDIGI